MPEDLRPEDQEWLEELLGRERRTPSPQDITVLMPTTSLREGVCFSIQYLRATEELLEIWDEPRGRRIHRIPIGQVRIQNYTRPVQIFIAARRLELRRTRRCRRGAYYNLFKTMSRMMQERRSGEALLEMFRFLDRKRKFGTYTLSRRVLGVLRRVCEEEGYALPG
jgi:hypothetical protein